MRATSITIVGGLLLICLIGTASCSRGNSRAPSADGSGSSGSFSQALSHGHGPNGGHIVPLDTLDYNAELVQDFYTNRVGVYLLDGGASAMAALPIETTSVKIGATLEDKPTEFELKAVALPNDAAGKSSYFEIESEPLLTLVAGMQMPKSPPELRLTIDGKTFTGTIVDQHAYQLAIPTAPSDGPDKTLVWRQELNEADYKIALGHHGVVIMAGSELEPAVLLTRGGEPVADAKVFNSLLDADGDSVLAEEVAAVYEPPAGEEPAHYAQGGLKIPPGTREAILRFRIVLPNGGGERSFDVPVPVQ